MSKKIYIQGNIVLNRSMLGIVRVIVSLIDIFQIYKLAVYSPINTTKRSKIVLWVWNNSKIGNVMNFMTKIIYEIILCNIK